ncbi:MAG: PEGA domain-containing protein [Myxococcota bacterium]
MERIGPYVVERELRRGFGARLLEAKDGEGRAILLQVARLRSARDDHDRAQRQRYERSLGAKTAELIQELPIEIIAQGATDAGDQRLVFWVLPLPALSPLSEGPEESERVARDVLERLVNRHLRGRTDPLLSEDFILKLREGGFGFAHVPIAVSAEWLSEEWPGPRLAPEEQDQSFKTTGDLWRLGRALSALEAKGLALSDAVTGLARALVNPDASERPTAAQALERLTATPSDATLRVLVPAEAAVPTKEIRAKSLNTGETTPPVDPSEISTSLSSFYALPRTEVEAPKAMTPRPELLNAPATGGEEATIDPAAVAWAPALMPEGASPWSEVVSARGMKRPEFTGFVGELPKLSADQVDAGATTVGPAPKAPEAPKPSPESAPAWAPPELNPRKIAMGAAATLLIFGLLAFVLRGRPEPIAALEGLVATASNDIAIDTNPTGATVVAEADGRVLGQTPLSFLIPPGAEAAILLAHPGYEPQRLILPDRGHLVLSLVQTEAKPCALDIDAPAAIEGVGADIGEAAPYRIPGAAVVRPKASGEEAYTGARIVRCFEGAPSAVKLRFARTWDPAAVRVTHPPGLTATIDGDPMGTLPAVHPARHAFSLVRILDANGASTERWVPSSTDVEVRMPQAPIAALAPSIEAVELVSVAQNDPTPPVRRPKEREARDPSALLRAGNDLLTAGHTMEAKDRFVACLRLDPGAAACHRALGEVYRREDATAQAKSHFLRYLELAPDAPDAPFVKSLLRQWD